MLIKLCVNNLLSFGEETVFSLEAGKVTRHRNHVRKAGGKSILRGCVLFGANAAGKSNLLKSIALIERMMIRNSCVAVADCQFVLGDRVDHDMHFKIEYEYNGHIFEYQISTDGSVVIAEVLHCLDGNSPELLFSRKESQMNLGARLKDYTWYEQRTCKSDAFYLMKLSQDGLFEYRKTIPESKIMLDACFGMKQFIVIDASQSSLLADKYYARLQMDEFRKFLVGLLKFADVGITDVDYRILPENEAALVLSRHRGVIPEELNEGWSKVVFDTPSYYLLQADGAKISVREICCKHGKLPFRASAESQGVIKLIQFSSMLFQLKTRKMVWCVDEFDAKLHTILSQELLKWFMDDKEELRSQLIIAAHDTNLLTHDIWRTDEIVIVSKSNHKSELRRLDSLSPRFDKRLAKGYLKGEYGAIPKIQSWLLKSKPVT